MATINENFVPKADSTNPNLANFNQSAIFENATGNVGINVSNPGAKLEVGGGMIISDGSGTESIIVVGPPTDSAATDRPAIQAAIESMAGSGGGLVVLQKGHYRVNDGGSGYGILLRSGVRLGGCGMIATRIRGDSDNIDIIRMEPPSGSNRYMFIKDLMVEAINSRTGVTGINVYSDTGANSPNPAFIENVKVAECSVGINVMSWFTEIHQCRVSGCTKGINLAYEYSPGTFDMTNASTILHTHIWGSSTGVYIRGLKNQVIGCNIGVYSSFKAGGTVQKTASSTTVTGTNTTFTTQLAVGDVIIIPGTDEEERTVTAIASDTSLTVDSAFANSANGQTMAVVPQASYRATGTVSKTAASSTLTGTNTLFLTQVAVGDQITVPGTTNEIRTVTAIASNTSLTVDSNFANTATGQTMTVVVDRKGVHIAEAVSRANTVSDCYIESPTPKATSFSRATGIEVESEGNTIIGNYFDVRESGSTPISIDSSQIDGNTLLSNFDYDDASNVALDTCLSAAVGIGVTSPRGTLQLEDKGLLDTSYPSSREIALRYNNYYSAGSKWLTASGKRCNLVLCDDGIKFMGSNDSSSGAGNTVTNFNNLAIMLLNGNMGIGTVSPAEKLHVKGGSIKIENTADAKLLFRNGDGKEASIQYDYDTNGMEFRLDGSGARLFIAESGGNVGIGKTNPGELLDVDSSGYIKGKLKTVNGDEGHTEDIYLATSGGGAVQLRFKDGILWDIVH